MSCRTAGVPHMGLHAGTLNHTYEELPDGSAECFECGYRLSRRDWAKRRRERDRQEQSALEIAGAQSCPRQVGQAKTRDVMRRQND